MLKCDETTEIKKEKNKNNFDLLKLVRSFNDLDLKYHTV